MRRFLFIYCFLMLTSFSARAQEITVGALTFPGDPFDQYMQRFAMNLQAQALPGVSLKLLIRGEVGPEEVLMRSVRRGRVEIASFTASGLSAVLPEFDLLRAPYLFSSFEEVDYALDQYIAPLMVDLLAAQDLQFLVFSDEGWFNLYGQSDFVSPKSTQGERLRALQSPASQSFIRSIGADMIQIPFADVMTGLQTGLISGGETGTMIYAAASLSEEAPYLTLTRHAYSAGAMVAYKPWYDSLSRTVRIALVEAVPPVTFIRPLLRKWISDELKGLGQRGVSIRDLTKDQRKQWSDATRTNLAALVANMDGKGDAMYAAIIDAKKSFSQRD